MLLALGSSYSRIPSFFCCCVQQVVGRPDVPRPREAVADPLGQGPAARAAGHAHEPEPRRRRVGERVGWTKREIYKDGRLVGELAFNHVGTNLNAHCHHPAHAVRGNCHTDRLVTGGRRPGQGRPLGFLVAWLLEQGAHEDKESHQQMKSVLGSAAGFVQRQQARQWLREQGTFDDLFALERPRRDAEGSEPEVCP